MIGLANGRPVSITGLGCYVPDRVLTNDELAEMVDTSDEWIRERTGIRERRIASREQAMSDIALPAALAALEEAGLEGRELDLIVVATVTPDMAFPSTGAILGDLLHAPDAASYDLIARMLARHLGRHIPGNPGIVVQNMPGAGGLRATNWLHSVAPRDGTVLGIVARDMPLLAGLGINRAAAFDPRRFTWLGSASDFSRDAYLLMVRADAPAHTIEAARRPGGPALVLGGTAAGATGSDVPMILRDTVGINVKLVEGYQDSGAIFLAVDRGEINGRTVDLSSMKSFRPAWMAPNGGMRALVQFARATRHPELPDVPTARELARNDAARQVIELAELSYLISRPFAAPPDVPA